MIDAGWEDTPQDKIPSNWREVPGPQLDREIRNNRMRKYYRVKRGYAPQFRAGAGPLQGTYTRQSFPRMKRQTGVQ